MAVNVLIAYTQHTKRVGFYLSLEISVTVSIFTVNTFMLATLTTTSPILFTAIP